jgi:exopolysaccharide production protein ExoZ
VDIFFVLSGFIMVYTCWPLFGSPSACLGFFRSRVLSIYPLHLVCLAVLLSVWFLVIGYRSLSFDSIDLLSSIFLLPFGRQIHGVTWTLVHEMIFYALFAVFLLISSRRLALSCLVLLLAVLTLAPLLHPGLSSR